MKELVPISLVALATFVSATAGLAAGPQQIVTQDDNTCDADAITAANDWLAEYPLGSNPQGEELDGCTRSFGYWRAASTYGEGAYGPTWERLPDGEDTPFFLIDQSYYEVLVTPPAGLAPHYLLARQYIAAELNVQELASRNISQASASASSSCCAPWPASTAAASGMMLLRSVTNTYSNGAMLLAVLRHFWPQGSYSAT